MLTRQTSMALFLGFVMNVLFNQIFIVDHNHQKNTKLAIKNRESCTTDQNILKKSASIGNYCFEDLCVYTNACYDLNSRQWEVDQANTNATPLLNNMGSTSKKENNIHSNCNEVFSSFQVNGTMTKYERLYVRDTSYFVCCWVNHFGHILLNMIVPAVHTLSYLKENISASKFVIDHRFSNPSGSNKTVFQAFDFVAGHGVDSVINFQSLVAEAKANLKSKVCFQRLIVGMMHDSLLNNPSPPSPKSKIGMLHPLRQQLLQKFPVDEDSIENAWKDTVDMASPPKFSTGRCTMTILNRRYSRKLGNVDDIIQLAKTKFFNWNILLAYFDEASLRSQYYTIQSTNIFISMSGTGTHMAMFLPEGAVSIDILVNHRSVNKHLCGVLPSIICLSVESMLSKNQTIENNTKTFQADYDADLEALEEALQVAKDKIEYSNCSL